MSVAQDGRGWTGEWDKTDWRCIALRKRGVPPEAIISYASTTQVYRPTPQNVFMYFCIKSLCLQRNRQQLIYTLYDMLSCWWLHSGRAGLCFDVGRGHVGHDFGVFLRLLYISERQKWRGTNTNHLFHLLVGRVLEVYNTLRNQTNKQILLKIMLDPLFLKREHMAGVT